ncbi:MULTISPECIES: Fpg/Nei family DNA glycosylase [unclassified Streptomyces]|uniref:Fpg/Nei family DNA glycosylase n=1 Tax=unclassified Streptomyces TaxID=2593676 RepID=UPI000890EEAC|nr:MULTISPECIES: DNA-formamidopyrimidine glycosylase family protein [unclassified Streptomyces]PBC82413.1 endonuclease-8 [Streptomyces sp. 2321.6]SDR49787.1 endonuclease-8 [Streptomyces sp. KS_16]SEC56848.1 endonuclease-8 [Streptomyces sp. 2133.1]SEE97848.1 endonuclease-8 [Streptomyces sp. 2112.3]SNC68354.1 endonuclease-8 [Streptomyces sp. 2114.4]
MPEGHTIHRLALDHRARFEGGPVRASSPQGKFADGAALVDGQVMTTAEAHGKHLFLGFGPPRTSDDPPVSPPFDRGDPHRSRGYPHRWIHVHLGLFGKLGFGPAPAPPPTDTVRLRLANPAAYADLRGPTTCALISEDEKRAIHDRLGPDPLRPGDDGTRAWQRISRSRTTIAALLLDQKIIAGVGNVYRAEVLFRHHIDPYRPGRDLTRTEWDAIWSDLVFLMAEGVRDNRIDTVRPEHLPEAMGRPPRVDDHGGEVYVYRRAHQDCHLCGSEIRTAGLAARNLFWCPGCQPSTGGG